MVYDLTVTNTIAFPVQKKSALDSLSTSALVAISCCATGSNRGYDEFVPEHVSEKTSKFCSSGCLLGRRPFAFRCFAHPTFC